ncbi:MAG: hypothetical protein WCV90_08960 [Candidatus Woesearchaeota archaeon]|jgi:hypothetical protein
MKSHYFINKEGEFWLIRCRETGGTFSTAVWYYGKVTDQECPCCGKVVER